ncbi:MAG TPA: thiamine phosphate synthase [Verrucomicrobiae bacterium]|nr:thiamine phosphate synthase [Verrucomicrobiae bacterium]
MFPPLYAILDPDFTTVPLSQLGASLATAGVQLMQLRCKHASAARMHALAAELATLLRPMGARLIVNDRADVAALSGASGVHVGQEDLPVEDARRFCASPLWVGVSTHNLEQLREADRTSADYIAVGPVFHTGTKANPDPVVGIDFIRKARQLTRKPLVAIGGITLESAAEVFRAGADSLAVISDMIATAEPAQRAAGYLAIAGRERANRDQGHSE